MRMRKMRKIRTKKMRWKMVNEVKEDDYEKGSEEGDRRRQEILPVNSNMKTLRRSGRGGENGVSGGK